MTGIVEITNWFVNFIRITEFKPGLPGLTE
jgi:hypothetical protein